jgi:hypothetical protein
MPGMMPMIISDLVKWIIGNRAKVLRYTYFLQVCVGLFLMLFGYYTGKAHFLLIREGVRTTGTIVDYKEEHFRDESINSAFMPIVEFKARDRVIRFKDWVGTSSAGELNHTVTILYDKGDPSTAMIDRRLWNWFPWAPIFALGLFLTLVGIKNLFLTSPVN